MTTHNTLLALLFGAAMALPSAAQVGTSEQVEDQSAQTSSSATSEEDIATSEEDVAHALEGRVIDPNNARCYSLREGWFVEAGLDMTVLNPYGFDFSETFPKGRSHGISAAFGKQFSPEIALRFRMNWENGLPLFRNKRLEWMAPIDPDTHMSTNMDGGGAMFLYMDVPISLARLIDRNYCRRWDVLLTPRAGLGGNLAISSWSPYVGMGCGYTYRINRRVTLYSDLTYAGITSEFFSGVPGAGTGMSVSTGFNGIISLHAGVRVGL